MEEAVFRLKQIQPTIKEAMAIGGAVGLSYGVIHSGKPIHTESFGLRDQEKGLPVNTKTMFSICSMTKGLVTSALGLLVEEGKLDWDKKVKLLLPGYDPQSTTLSSATLIDYLSMRSGIEAYNVWTQSDNRVNFRKRDNLKIINSLRATTDLRYKWAYNNWGYEIAGTVCDHISSETWDSMLHTRFFEPLNMNRTDASGDRENFDNITKAYMVQDNGTPVEVPLTNQSGKTLMGPAGGVVSCIDDLLVLYKTILAACKHQFTSGETSTPGNPFKQLATTMSAHMQLPGTSFRESSYGLGWIRTELPNKMCKISPNYGLLGNAPVVGEGAASKLVVAHYGSMPGSYSGVVMFPETESAIVVLTNTTPRCDMADWMTQLLTQTLFDFPQKNDYLAWIQRTVDAELEWHGQLLAELKEKQRSDAPSRSLEMYVGRYYNVSGTLLLEVKMKEEELLLAFEGRDDDSWALEHCENDTFCWLHSRDELISRGRTVLQPLSYYMIYFETDQEGRVVQLRWSHDQNYSQGEVYKTKQNS